MTKRRAPSQRLAPADLQEIAGRAAEWRAYDECITVARERAALTAIAKRLSDAAAFLGEVTAGRADIEGETPLRAAWQTLNARSTERGGPRPRQAADGIAETLASWAALARETARTLPAKRSRTASSVAADMLVQARRSRGFAVSSYLYGQAVQELVTVTKKARCPLTPDAAHKAIKAALGRAVSSRK